MDKIQGREDYQCYHQFRRLRISYMYVVCLYQVNDIRMVNNGSIECENIGLLTFTCL